jgi:hypothetical protein
MSLIEGLGKLMRVPVVCGQDKVGLWPTTLIENAGWHLSCFMSAEVGCLACCMTITACEGAVADGCLCARLRGVAWQGISNKIQAFAHEEVNTPEFHDLKAIQSKLEQVTSRPLHCPPFASCV